MTNDAQLIEQARAGDTAAFGELVRKYQGRLYNTMLHVTGQVEEAEDVVQDTFVQAFLKLDSFAGKSAFYTWIYRIAFNVAVSRRRRKRPRESVEAQRELLGAEPADNSESAAEMLLRQEQIERVHAALNALDEEYRAILVLREIEGCCYDTIGEILELAPGTVKSRIHRARIQLRDQLKDMLAEHLVD